MPNVADKRSLGVIGLMLAGVTFAVVRVAAAVVQAHIGELSDLEDASEQVMSAQASASSQGEYNVSPPLRPPAKF